MSRSTAALDVWCDAPCYAIVQACQWLGFQRPLDVAWYHRGRYLQAHRPTFGLLDVVGLVSWLFGRDLAPPTCRCGHALPALERCFATLDGEGTPICVGQCQHCHTIFWDEFGAQCRKSKSANRRAP